MADKEKSLEVVDFEQKGDHILFMIFAILIMLFVFILGLDWLVF